MDLSQNSPPTFATTQELTDFTVSVTTTVVAQSFSLTIPFTQLTLTHTYFDHFTTTSVTVYAFFSSGCSNTSHQKNHTQKPAASVRKGFQARVCTDWRNHAATQTTHTDKPKAKVAGITTGAQTAAAMTTTHVAPYHAYAV